jgi:hypothetical protein
LSTSTAARTSCPSKARHTTRGSAGPALRPCGLSAEVRSQESEVRSQNGEQVGPTLCPRLRALRFPLAACVFLHKQKPQSLGRRDSATGLNGQDPSPSSRGREVPEPYQWRSIRGRRHGPCSSKSASSSEQGRADTHPFFRIPEGVA